MSDVESPLRPMRRLSERRARALVIAFVVVTVCLVANLVVIYLGDRNGPRPASLTRRDRSGTPVVMIDSDYDEFDAGLGVFPGLDTPWRVTGDVTVRQGALHALGPLTAQIDLPDGDKVLQTVVNGSGRGWTVAFAYRDPFNYWGVGLGPSAVTLLRVVDGEAEAVARQSVRSADFVETVVVWREGAVSVRSGGNQLWLGTQDEVGGGGLGLLALGETEDGVESVAVRSL